MDNNEHEHTTHISTIDDKFYLALDQLISAVADLAFGPIFFVFYLIHPLSNHFLFEIVVNEKRTTLFGLNIQFVQRLVESFLFSGHYIGKFVQNDVILVTLACELFFQQLNDLIIGRGVDFLKRLIIMAL